MPLGRLDLDGHEHVPQGVLVVPAPPVAVYLGFEDHDIWDGFEASYVHRTLLLAEFSEVRGDHLGNPDLHVHPELPGRNSSVSPQTVVEERLVVELGAE